jgi:hypothetical protein
MIDEDLWTTSGVWGDSNSPDLSLQQTTFFGVRYVTVSLAEAYKKLGQIGSVVLFWKATLPSGTNLQMFTRLDGETDWNTIENKSYVQGVNRDLANPGSRSIEIKIRLSSTMTEINPAEEPELTDLLLVVYRSGSEHWKSQNLIELAWKE